MSKEAGSVIVSMDKYFLEDHYSPDASAKEILEKSFGEISEKFKPGNLITGIVSEKDGGGLYVAMGYKSDGYIPANEFSAGEADKFELNSEIEVLIESLEDADGNVVLSYQKAKAIKVWNEVMAIAEQGGSVTGYVTSKVKGGLNVDIGIPAFLPGSQIDLHRVKDFDQYVGTEVECKIIKVNKKRGNVILSRRKQMEEERSEVKKSSMQNLVEGQILQGIVKNITNYGAFVDIGGIDGLLHITDMSWGRISHPSEMVKLGDEITVKVISFDKEHEKISLGTKQLSDNPWKDADKKFPEGTKIKGRISSITDYGMFVEVASGVEGLVHISEISWTERVQDLSKRYTVGDEVLVVVSKVEKDERRMSLSIKRMDDDPWKTAFDKFKPGDRVKGTVSNITDFGIFVTIHPGVDGLVHISDISWIDHVAHPSEKFKRGDKVDVVVISVEEDKRRISLGIKQLDEDPWGKIEEKYPVGMEVIGQISKVTSFGIFVKLLDGVEGLAHISELPEKDLAKLEAMMPVGSERKFTIVKSSATDRKLRLSLRSAEEIERDAKKAPHSGHSGAPYVKKDFHKGGQNQDGQRGMGGHPKRKSSGSSDYSNYSSSPMKSSMQLAMEEAQKSGALSQDMLSGSKSKNDDKKEE